MKIKITNEANEVVFDGEFREITIVNTGTNLHIKQPVSTSGGAVFPPFGRSGGQPVVGASMGDLNFYKSAVERSMADESKSKYYDKNKELLKAIVQEIERQSSGGNAKSGDVPF